MNTKEEVLEYMQTPKTIKAKNSMGCSENWYNPYYAIYKTFSLEEVLSMNDKEVENLIKLADNISEGLY